MNNILQEVQSKLHKTELEEFKAWLDGEKIKYRVIKYGPEVLKISVNGIVTGRNCRWSYVYKPAYESDYFVNNMSLNGLVFKFNTRRKS